VKSEEDAGVEVGLQRIQRRSNQVPLVPPAHFGVDAARIDVVDVLDRHYEQSTATLHRDTLQVRRLSRLGREPEAGFQDDPQLISEDLQIFDRKALAGSAKRFLEALVRVRFQQIVRRGELEGLDCELVVRRNEHGHRHEFGSDRSHHFEAVPVRNVHIEEHDIGIRVTDGVDRCLAVFDQVQDRHPVSLGKQILDALPCQGLIVDDQDARDTRGGPR